MKKLNIGSGWRDIPGFTNVDGGDYPNVTSKDIYLKDYKSESVDLIYSSHLLEYFNYQEAQNLLGSWHTKLKKEGQLYLSVPDFEVLTEAYRQGTPLSNLIGPLYGRMDMGKEEIYHKCVWDEQTLNFMLKLVGFKRIERYSPLELIGDNDDHSKAKLNGRLISLNLKAVK
jgi:predicted SAM-dependent methyltransferase